MKSFYSILRDTSKIGVKSGDGKKEAKICTDCRENGQCMLTGREIASNGITSSWISNNTRQTVKDIENWVPHSFDKLRQESCPFHRLKSLGLELCMNQY